MCERVIDGLSEGTRDKIEREMDERVIDGLTGTVRQ